MLDDFSFAFSYVSLISIYILFIFSTANMDYHSLSINMNADFSAKISSIFRKKNTDNEIQVKTN